MISKERLAEMKGRFNGCPLFEGRTKGEWDTLVNKSVKIEEYYKLTGDKGDYYAVTLEGDAEHFYLSGGAVTSLIDEFGADAKEVSFTVGAKTKTKNKNDYRPITIN